MASAKLIVILLVVACLSLVLAAPLPVDRHSLQKRCQKEKSHENNSGYYRDDDREDRDNDRKHRGRHDRDDDDDEERHRGHHGGRHGGHRGGHRDDDDEEDSHPTTTEAEDWEPTTTTEAWEPTTTTTTTTTWAPKPTHTTTTEDEWEPTTTTTTTTTTTHTPKPTTTTEDEWEPTTTTTRTRTTTTTEKPEPTNGGGSGGGGGTYSGEGTWYDVGLGSCGTTNSNSEYVAALNYIQMANGANPNNNPKCGDKLRINGPKGSVTVTIVDTCPTCAYGDVDLSPAAFAQLADLDDGRINIKWSFA